MSTTIWVMFSYFIFHQVTMIFYHGYLMKDKIKKNQFITQIVLLMSIIGPGLITANIDNDAGGIATYSLAGAKTGYRLLWIILPITVALIIVQEMSARMGVVSGKGLADLIREKFGARTTFYTIIFLVIADLETLRPNLQE